MLDAYIIDQIRRQEEERRRDSARPRLYIEIPRPPPGWRPPEPPKYGDQDEDGEENGGRPGPVVIPLYDDPDPSEDAA